MPDIGKLYVGVNSRTKQNRDRLFNSAKLNQMVDVNVIKIKIVGIIFELHEKRFPDDLEYMCEIEHDIPYLHNILFYETQTHDTISWYIPKKTGWEIPQLQESYKYTDGKIPTEISAIFKNINNKIMILTSDSADIWEVLKETIIK